MQRAWDGQQDLKGARGTAGSGMMDDRFLQLRQTVGAGGTLGLAVISDGSEVQRFDIVGGNYVSHYYARSTLSYGYNSATGRNEFTLTEEDGSRSVFLGNDQANAALRLKMVGRVDAAGNSIAVTYDSQGRIGSVTQSQDGITETFTYTYSTSNGFVTQVVLARDAGQGAQTVRTAHYSYYAGGESFGNAGQLKTVTIKEDGQDLETKYYRYYKPGESNGYEGGLKMIFSGPSFARADEALGDALTASDVTIKPYANNYFEYDSQKRVTLETAAGVGCSGSCGGQGTFTYSYSTSVNPDGRNSWKYKTVETLPDGNQNTVYANFASQVMLKVFKNTATGQQWGEFHQYNDNGQEILSAQPSAVDLPSSLSTLEQYADLLHATSGNYQYLRDSAGLIETTSFYGSTTGTESTAGGAAGYEYQEFLKHGETASGILQSTLAYFTRTAGGATIHPLAASAVYRNDNGTGGQTTSYSYTYLSGAAQVASMTTSLPVVSTAQNGPDSADVSIDVFDDFGRVTWSKDADGFISHMVYDTTTGSLTASIADVDTSLTSDEPSGWETPAGGGLHLQTVYTIDSLGRVTQTTDPAGRITRTEYDDANHEVRSYAWDPAGSGSIIGPVSISREDRQYGYSESRTETAGGTLLSLSRTYTNSAGQVSHSDQYFDFTGWTYSTDPEAAGTEGTDFYRTSYEYEKRGRNARTQSPTGTISHVFYDGLGRTTMTWVGTDDTPTSDLTGDSVIDWRDFRYGVMVNGVAPAGTNLVKISQSEYDGGGVGDGNLTRSTQFPGGGAANRVSEFYYDWRNRQVASKSGVQTSESTSDNSHPISYVDYDNLSQVTASYGYDGDGVTITDANSDGVPDKPSASLLRSKSTSEYDEQGRTFASHTFSVNPSDGSVSTSSLDSQMWYDHRGNVIKTVGASGLVNKSVYDGAGRQTKSYSTDGGGDSGWADADDVSGDKVLEQSVTTYDDAGNVILSAGYQRFHDTSDTGELDDTNSRISYSGVYYDAAGRTTASVNVGTNAGSAWTRPGTVPARSDTVLVSSYTYDAAGRVDEVTDPKGIVSKSYYDALSRTTKTIEAYTDGTPTDSSNRVTEYTYDGSGHTITMKAVLPNSAFQETAYVYGTDPSRGDGIASNDILAAIRYPDKTTGEASNVEQDTFAVNALGQRIYLTDRNSNGHLYEYDVLGRMTGDIVSTLGTGVDGAVRRIGSTFNTQGLIDASTSYSDTAGTAVVNQIKREYNGLGQMTAEYQEHDGAVDGSTLAVEYGYGSLASGSRLTAMTYPNGRELTYTYASGLDNTIGRLSSISDSGGTLESYQYLGLGTVAIRTHGNGVSLTYVKLTGESNGEAGDHYVGLDRFGRVVDQRWVNSGGTAVDHFQYGYDRNSNRTSKSNELHSAFDETYEYDDLNRLTSTDRDGTQHQAWDLDALGNSNSVTTDSVQEDRTHNAQNQLTEMGSATLTFDDNGNTTTDHLGRTLVYDAWNRLVEGKDGETSLIRYEYDATTRRIEEGSKVLYFSSQWQIVEERESGVAVVQQVWSPVYVDAAIARDRDTDANGSLEERIYLMQDANFNVTSIANTSAAVIERYLIESYGKRTVLTTNWQPTTTNYAQRQGFQGGFIDTVLTSQINFRNRITDVDMMRWLQPDYIGGYVDGMSLYQMERSSPVRGHDPFGWATTQPAPPATQPAKHDGATILTPLIIADMPAEMAGIAVANVTGQLGATVSEVFISPMRLYDYIHERAGGRPHVLLGDDLGKSTVWGKVQRGCNQGYKAVWEHTKEEVKKLSQ